MSAVCQHELYKRDEDKFKCSVLVLRRFHGVDFVFWASFFKPTDPASLPLPFMYEMRSVVHVVYVWSTSGTVYHH